MNTEQTLESAENQLEKDEQQMECLHEYHRVSSATTEDGTVFVNSMCLHCNHQIQHEE